MNYSFTDKCKKDLKRLLKRYRSLENDIETFCRSIVSIDFDKNSKIVILHRVGDLLIIKSRLFCESLKKRSLRIIFSYDTASKSIIHIEIYFKGDKVAEDKQRISDFIKNLTPS